MVGRLLHILVMVMHVERAIGIQTCEEDHECREGEFCYTTHHCVLCYNCEEDFFRNKKDKLLCSKNFNMCGECLPGYKEEILTGGAIRDQCVPDCEDDPGLSTRDIIYITTGTLVCVILVVACCLCLYCKNKVHGRRSKEDLEQQNVQNKEVFFHERAPPAYSYQQSCPSAPLLDTSESRGSSRAVEVTDIRRPCYDRAQLLHEATPFQFPRQHYQEESAAADDNDEETASSEEEEEEAAGGEASADDNQDPQDFLIEEETVESEWTPGTGYNPAAGEVPPTRDTAVDTGDSGASSSSSLELLSVTRGTVRSHAEDHLSSSTAKRQRRDSGTQSLSEDSIQS